MQKVVGEIFLDDIAFVSTANHEIVYSVSGINFHDMPKNGLATNFDHRFGAK